MPEGKYLKETLYPLGNVSRETEVEFEIEFTSEVEDKFQYLQKSCGCTQVLSSTEEIQETGKVKVKFIVKNSGVPTTPGVHQVNRTITFYFKDGEPDFILGQNGQRVANPKKTTEKFTIVGTATVD